MSGSNGIYSDALHYRAKRLVKHVCHLGNDGIYDCSSATLIKAILMQYLMRSKTFLILLYAHHSFIHDYSND